MEEESQTHYDDNSVDTYVVIDDTGEEIRVPYMDMNQETHFQFEDTHPNPFDQFMPVEKKTHIWAAIEKLKPDAREIITLNHFHNYSNKGRGLEYPHRDCDESFV